MSLEVEDGTGRADAESYASVATANAYHTAFGFAGWTGTDTVKEQALRKATQFLDGFYTFRGEKKYVLQALQWPRVGYADDESWPPRKLVHACCELALRALSGELVEDKENQLITREVIGPIATHYAYKSSQVSFPTVDLLLKELTFSSGSSIPILLTG